VADGAGGGWIEYACFEGLAAGLVEVSERSWGDAAGRRLDGKDTVTVVLADIKCVVDGEYSEYGFGGRAVGWKPSVGSCIGQCEGDWLKGYSIIERDIEVDGRDAAGVASNPFDGVAGVGDISFAAVGDDDGDAGRGGVTSGAGDKVVLYVDEIDIGDAPGKVGVLAKVVVSVISVLLLKPSRSESLASRLRMSASSRLGVASTASP
jgi:hypothetical protein